MKPTNTIYLLDFDSEDIQGTLTFADGKWTGTGIGENDAKSLNARDGEFRDQVTGEPVFEFNDVGAWMLDNLNVIRIRLKDENGKLVLWKKQPVAKSAQEVIKSFITKETL